MDWIEITLRTRADMTDTIADMLDEYGYQGVVVERGDIPDTDPWDEHNIPPAQHHIIRGYIPDDDSADATRRAVMAAFAALPIEQPVFRNLKEENWAEAWKKHYHPVRLGERIVVRPPWEAIAIQPDDVEIVLDPGMAFGTGTHPTTQLCLEAMETLPLAGATVLDLGTGSAILAIAAAKLGAARVDAVDNDPVAIEAAAKNVTVNSTDEVIKLATGTLVGVREAGQQYNVALVNILARVIIPMCDEGLGDVVKPGGEAVFGGLIMSQADDVEAALRRTGLTPVSRQQRGDWVLIKAAKNSSSL